MRLSHKSKKFKKLSFPCKQESTAIKDLWLNIFVGMTVNLTCEAISKVKGSLRVPDLSGRSNIILFNHNEHKEGIIDF